MRKHFLIAGMLLAVALVFAGPSKADTVQFSLSGINASFTLPDTFTPDFTFQGTQYVFDVMHGTLLAGTDVTFGTIDLGNSASGVWSFGSQGHTLNGQVFPGPELGVFAPGLLTMNADGTITVNAGTWAVTNFRDQQLTLTTTVIPGPPVGTPEPATLALLGVGSLGLAALLRRRAA